MQSNVARWLAPLALLCSPLLSYASATPTNPDRWELRTLADGNAIAVIGGSGAVKTLSLMCRGTVPVAAMVLADEQPRQQPTTANFSFGLIRVDVPLTQETAQGTVWFADLSRSPLPKLLASESGFVKLSLNGEEQGQLSLKGSTSVTRKALAACNSRN